MIRNGGAIILSVREVGLMAAVAIRGRVTGGVVAAQVAVGTSIDNRPDRAGYSRTRGCHMRTLQREAGRGVVKFSIRPEHRVMAGRAERGRKACRNVVRHIPAKRWGGVPGRLVAEVAIRVCSGGGIVVAHVAIGAGQDFSGGRKLGRNRQRPAGWGAVKNNI